MVSPCCRKWFLHSSLQLSIISSEGMYGSISKILLRKAWDWNIWSMVNGEEGPRRGCWRVGATRAGVLWGTAGCPVNFGNFFFFLRDTVKSYSKADGIIYTWRVNWRYRELWENPGVSFIRMTQVNFDPLQWSCSHRAPCKKERYSKKSKVQMWKLGSISLT